MSTNATQRNNITKRGSNILCGNIVNKEKDLNNLQMKKSSVITSSLLNGITNIMNTIGNAQNNIPTNNGLAKNGNITKIDNNIKIRVKPKENNENDKNAVNLNLKRKLTIEVENTKKSNLNINNYFLNNQNQNLNNVNSEKDQIRITVKNQHMENTNSDTNMNISMKESFKELILSENTEMATEEPCSNSYMMTNNTLGNESKTERNHVICSKRCSLPNMRESNNFIAKSLLHGEIKKKPTLNNINNISGFEPNNCSDEVIFENNKTNIHNSQTINNVSNSNNSKINFKSIINGISINSNLNSLHYSFNLENITISKDNQPKFTNEEYIRMFTRLIRKDLGKSFLQNLFNEEEALDDFLISHKITERMRTRMIDWMIEVLTNYKCDDNTFFIAVNTMDRYFKALGSASLQPNELHLIGVAAMFMASKYEDIYPLRLRIVHEKISHKKLSCQEIKEKETEISVGLGFVLGKPTIWDFINHFIEEIFYTQVNNFQVQDKSLNENYGGSMGTVSSNLLKVFSEYEKEVFKNYTTNMLNLLRHVVVYLAKMNYHDYILSTKKPSLIAASTIFVAMKICEQINKEEYVNEYFSKKLTEISQKNENEIIKTAQKILYNAQNFDSIFNGLENLKKIHFNAIIDLKNTK